MDDKENFAPLSPRRTQNLLDAVSSTKHGRKGRSKSIGPGGIEEIDQPKNHAKDRRKSAFTTVMKGILPGQEDAERRAARRKSMANRRVSFAPEATLHTWNIIEHIRDHTTSTESSESTRRASSLAQQSSAFDADQSEPPSTPPEFYTSPREEHRRPESAVKGHAVDMGFSSGESDGSDVSDVESGDGSEEGDEEEDATGTAMSLDMDEATIESTSETTNSSTSSSAALERNLQMAAQTAGTRGIDYDENGEMSMEIAGDEITNAFKPWIERNDDDGLEAAFEDQENINPFPAMQKPETIHVPRSLPGISEHGVDEDDDENVSQDMSMDVTRAVGGIVRSRIPEPASSPFGENTMEFTQAVGKIQFESSAERAEVRSGQKRRRSTSEAGSPGAQSPQPQTKRSRHSTTRQSLGETEMDLTMAVGGIRDKASSKQEGRRRSTAARRSSALANKRADATDNDTVVTDNANVSRRVSGESIDDNEELSMELTTIMGGITDVVEEDRTSPKKMQSTMSPPKPLSPATADEQEHIESAHEQEPDQYVGSIGERRVSSKSTRRSSLRPRKSISPKKSPATSTTEKPDIARSPRRSSRLNSTPNQVKIGSPLKHEVSFSDMSDVESIQAAGSITPQPLSSKVTSTPQSKLRQQLSIESPPSQPSPMVEKQMRSTPAQQIMSTPPRAQTPPSVSRDVKTLADSIRLMSTPRKETLKALTPKNQTPVRQQSPAKRMQSPIKSTTKTRAAVTRSSSAQSDDERVGDSSQLSPVHVRLQEFLDEAGIRFMDLTTTKRRLTAAPTPSKNAKKTNDGLPDEEVFDEMVTLESAVVAAACLEPELELFKHACHELRRYIDEGKSDIRALEAETYRETPPLVQTYMSAGPEQREIIDAQMRDIKTNSRLRSKEMWYGWRSNLVDDLMRALQGIAEGLLQDDDILQQKEEAFAEMLPTLVDQRGQLQAEATRLETTVARTSEDEKEELRTAREQLVDVDAGLHNKRLLLQQLQQEASELDSHAEDLEDMKDEFNAVIVEADRMREACRTISMDEIDALQDTVTKLEETHGWTISSASTDPTITMAYKSQLELFFHPAAFIKNADANAPIGLQYTGSAQKLPTVLRFFLQLLRANLHTLNQSSTVIGDMLRMISSGWDTALAVTLAERQLTIEGPTNVQITGDEHLSISTSILLPAVRTKVLTTLDLLTTCVEGQPVKVSVKGGVKVIYGEPYNEKKMTEFLETRVEGRLNGWAAAVRELREKLVARGPKSIKSNES